MPTVGAARHAALPNVSPLQHIVILTMENRSFDSMFGAYPGANGIQSPGICDPDPRNGGCVYAYHDTSLFNHGGPHSDRAELTDLDGGLMDGFVATAEKPPGRHHDNFPLEVMGYHTCDELPTYCDLAAHGVLADNAFAPTTSWSTMAHLFMVSGWSAKCATPGDPMSCTSFNSVNVRSNPRPDFAWTDITWLLHANGVSWAYYVYDKTNPFVQGDGDDESDDEVANPYDVYNKMGKWNPLPGFDDVAIDGEIGNIQPGVNFEAAASAGTLPSVVWVVPSFDNSDHPPQSLANGQAWVQRMVNAVENGPDASSTLVILWWDEWGGFSDHVVPPIVDGLGYGFRVPMILYGPLVKAGTIDHQLLSSDAYLKLIEDTFLGGARLDANDGRPDSRPDVRENYAGLGDLRLDLNTGSSKRPAIPARRP